MNADRTRSASRRVNDAIHRIATRDSELHAVTALGSPRALKLAETIAGRSEIAEGQHPVEGLILAVKDNMAVEGMPWTAGLGVWKSRTATTDAKVVRQLVSFGSIPLAMVNMDEGALGATTDNPHFGRTNNPLDPDRTPGGSSGGSAVAVAAGYVDAALGSDTMGSVRIPAAYCGVVGLKPTRGLVPRTGLTHLSPTLDTIGPIAKDVATVRHLVAVMANNDDQDAGSVPAPADWLTDTPSHGAAGFRLGIPKQIGEVGCECEILDGLDVARAKLERIGCQVHDVEVRGWLPDHCRRGGLMLCEAEGAIELAEALAVKGNQAVGNQLRVMLLHGRNLTSEKLVDGFSRVRNAAAAAERALADCDAILMPTAPQRAFPHGVEVPVNQADFTSLANFYGGPAVAIPVPASGLPASVQIMGRPFSESLILWLAEQLEKALRD